MSLSLQLKRVIGATRRSATSADRKVVLLYHAIGDGEWEVSESGFKEQMVYVRNTYQCLDLHQLINNGQPEILQVAITFDDGYVSLLETVAPILRALNLTATVYLSTAYIGDTRTPSDLTAGHYADAEFMSWQDIEVLANMGWRIGSHGHRHIDYRTIEVSAVAEELELSKNLIEEKLNQPCTDLAFPYGAYDPELLELGNEIFVSVATGIHGPLSSPREMNRIDVRREYEMDDFKAICRGDWDFLGSYQKLRRWMR